MSLRWFAVTTRSMIGSLILTIRFTAAQVIPAGMGMGGVNTIPGPNGEDCGPRTDSQATG